MRHCPSCAAPNPEGQRFCGSCGAELTAESDLRDVQAQQADPHLQDERKLATVLFADVVGFTSLSERTDPEVVAHMVDAAFKDLGEVVADHGGRVDKYMGDSLMAVFGVPVAHDDDAERAVAAGLAMRQLGGDLVFSIGINSGEVMATAVGRGDLTVIGDTVNVAARLEKAAAPGEVLCGRLTVELAGDRVKFRERQAVLLKGKSAPVEVWEALSMLQVGTGATAEGPPLIGRTEELSFLRSQWRRALRDRSAQVVVVCGEAGSGKTRLLDELDVTLGEEVPVVRCVYPAYGAMGGARVAAEIIGQLGPAQDPDVNARVRSVAGEIDDSLKSMDPAAVRQEQVWAFGRLLKEKAQPQGLLVVIDDMHRADDRTLELLGELAGRLSGIPLLTVLAGRTEPGEWLGRFRTVTTVRLGPLGPEDAVALADAFVGDKPFAPESANLLVELAGGNPLYLRELVSMTRARDMLVDDGAFYRITAHSGIPATLQALLGSRLDALEPSQKLVLQHCAVLGDATAEQIAALGSPDTRLVLGSLIEMRLLNLGPDGRYQASDPLLREVAYEMLPRNARGELHRRAAGLVSRPEERARHLDRAARYIAGDEAAIEEVAEALAATGEVLLADSRHLDAMGPLERAVELGVRRPQLLLALARIQALCGKEEEAFETLALVVDDPDDPSLSVERDHTEANVRTFTDPSWALPRLHEVARRWHELGNVFKEAWAYSNAGVAYFNLSRMREAAASLEKGLELFESIGDKSGAVSASSFLSLARPADPRVPKWLEDALNFADETGDRSKQITTLAALTWKHFFNSLGGGARDTEQAEGFAYRLGELAEELGANDMAVHGWALLAIMARLSGRLDEALDHVSALQRVSASQHSEPWLGWAAAFSVAVADGAPGAAAPFPPDTSPDPVVAMASLVIETELTLSGRFAEAQARFENVGPPELEGPMAEVGGLVYALALVLVGEVDSALPWVKRAYEAAQALGAGPAAVASAALFSEITGDTTALPACPSIAGGLADALVMRAYAAAGQETALDALRRAAETLVAPGLLAGT